MKKFLSIMLLLIFAACSKNPEAEFSWTPVNPKAGTEVQFKNSSTNASTYSWNLGNMSTSDEFEPKTIYQTPGNYIIDLYAYNGYKSDLKTMTITVSP